MGWTPRMTAATQDVLAALLADPEGELSGLQVCEEAGVPAGSIHPLLARLEGKGWVESRWEHLEPGEPYRPQRRYYRLTGVGASLARTALDGARRPALRLRWRPATGRP